jgi:hypothetical protein
MMALWRTRDLGVEEKGPSVFWSFSRSASSTGLEREEVQQAARDGRGDYTRWFTQS